MRDYVIKVDVNTRDGPTRSVAFRTKADSEAEARRKAEEFAAKYNGGMRAVIPQTARRIPV